MIIVEGCDGSGKTMLVQQLAQNFNLGVGQRRTSNRDELYKVTREDTYTALGTAVAGKQPAFIWDRLGPFSDPIYSRVGEREMAFKQEEMRHCMEIFKALRCPVIVCSIPLQKAEENQALAHQMDGVAENFRLIWELYERLKDAAVIELNAVVYNYERPGDYDKVVEKIRSYLTRRRDREWR